MQNPLDNEFNDEHNPTEDSISLTCWNNQLSVICALSDNSSNKIIVLSMISEHLQWVNRKYCEQIGETQSQEAQNPQLQLWQNPGKSVNPDCQQANLYILLLLSHFRRVWLCVTPQTAAHQAPPSLGFSRQEHWSGLPFPSPVHESEKVKVKSLSRVRLLAIPWTAAYQAPPSMGFFQARVLEWGAIAFSKIFGNYIKKKNSVL